MADLAQPRSPQLYTVSNVNYKGERDNPHGGVLHKFYVTLMDADGNQTSDVYWQRKSPDLSPASVHYGHIEDGEYGPRFKTDPRPDGSGNQGSSGGNFQRPNYQREGLTKDDYWGNKDKRDVESQARMGRAHAQEMAVRWFALFGEMDRYESQEQALRELPNVVGPVIDWFHQDVQRFPLDADVGGGADSSASGAAAVTGSVTADVSAESQRQQAHVEQISQQVAAPTEEASPAQKRKLTTLFNQAGIAKPAQKAIVLYRCHSEKATKDGASQLITDLLEGATREQLIAEIWDAHNAGNNPLATRAAKLIPSDVPNNEPEPEVVAPNGEKDIPF